MDNINEFYKIMTDLLLVCESAGIVHPAIKKAKLYLSNFNTDLIYNILYFVKVTFNISQEELDSNSRDPKIVKARRIFFNITKAYTKESLKRIGNMISKDHATVLHGLKKMQEFKDIKDPEWDEYIQCSKLFLLQMDIKANEKEKNL